MQVSCIAVLVQFFVIKIVAAQYSTPPNINQQLLTILLSPIYSEAEFPERIQILTSALQQMPSRRTVPIADALRQSALQSLTIASSVCQSLPDYNLPVGQSLTNQVQNVPRRVVVSEQLAGQMVLPLTEVLGQNGLSGQNGLAQLLGQNIYSQNRQFVLAGQNGLTGQSRQVLSGPNGLPVSIANVVKEVLLSGFTGEMPPRTVTIQY